jgi:hypothetical protein
MNNDALYRFYRRRCERDLDRLRREEQRRKEFATWWHDFIVTAESNRKKYFPVVGS